MVNAVNDVLRSDFRFCHNPKVLLGSSHDMSSFLLGSSLSSPSSGKLSRPAPPGPGSRHLEYSDPAATTALSSVQGQFSQISIIIICCLMDQFRRPPSSSSYVSTSKLHFLPFSLRTWPRHQHYSTSQKETPQLIGLFSPNLAITNFMQCFLYGPID